MQKVLNRCPLCGSRLEYHSLYQYDLVFKVLNNGGISSRPVRKIDDCPMESAFIACSNEDCNFATDCDLGPYDKKLRMRIDICQGKLVYENMDEE